MQLDKTRIRIRERGVTDILDLALHVLHAYFRPLMIATLLGALPFFLINELLVGWLIHIDVEDMATDEVVARSLRFMWIMAILVVVEAPAASIFTTTWLGHAVFTERPELRMVLHNIRSVAPRFIWTVLLMRGVLPILLLAMAMGRREEAATEVMLTILAGFICFLRAIRPFINEIVFLERNPLFSSTPNTMTISRRSALLHSPSGSHLMYQWLVAAVFGTLLAIAMFGALPTIQGVLWDRWTLSPRLIEFGWPIVLWLIVGFMTVVRFLDYLDLRIRHEGWEVELRMRAEGNRLLLPASERGIRARVN